MDLRKRWDLKDPAWRYDIMPEIMDGKNVSTVCRTVGLHGGLANVGGVWGIFGGLEALPWFAACLL